MIENLPKIPSLDYKKMSQRDRYYYYLLFIKECFSKPVFLYLASEYNKYNDEDVYRIFNVSNIVRKVFIDANILKIVKNEEGVDCIVWCAGEVNDTVIANLQKANRDYKNKSLEKRRKEKLQEFAKTNQTTVPAELPSLNVENNKKYILELIMNDKSKSDENTINDILRLLRIAARNTDNDTWKTRDALFTEYDSATDQDVDYFKTLSHGATMPMFRDDLNVFASRKNSGGVFEYQYIEERPVTREFATTVAKWLNIRRNKQGIVKAAKENTPSLPTETEKTKNLTSIIDAEKWAENFSGKLQGQIDTIYGIFAHEDFKVLKFACKLAEEGKLNTVLENIDVFKALLTANNGKK